MDEGVDAVSTVVVHPMVLLHVLDHHNRRQEASGRVIGTLLGRRDGRTVSDFVRHPYISRVSNKDKEITHTILAWVSRSKLRIALPYLMLSEATKWPLEKILTNRCLRYT